tara:strand:- start:2913 stop:3428 length:516 start_codon:yes stop_codon:yes gene_type:complete
MAGNLVQVDTETVTSAVASVTLTTINTDDVYMVAMHNVAPVTDNVYLKGRVTTGGTADSDSQYDRATKTLRANTSFGNGAEQNASEWYIQENTNGTGTSEVCNGIIYLYNFNNSSEYSFITVEMSSVDASTNHNGSQGARVHTVDEANDGINFFFSSGNIASGTFTLYKVI